MSTVQISASDVNKLRQQTGAGMMDCKKALTETNGDFEAAVDYLRKKGAKVAASRQDRESNEGVVIARTSADGKRGVIIELNCETDFVAKNAEFNDSSFAGITTKTQKLVDELDKGTTYYVRVRALGREKAGNVTQPVSILVR